MSRRLVDYDPVTGIAHWSEWNEIDDAFRYTAAQDATAILEYNAWLRSIAPARRGDGYSHPVARMDMVMWTVLKQAGIIDDPKRLQRWLDDPDNRKLLAR